MSKTNINSTNSTAYLGSITIITRKDGTGDLLYQNTLHPSTYNDPLSLRKLTCVMLSHFLKSVDLPANLELNLNVFCVNAETTDLYYVLDLNGSYETVLHKLDSEIDILDVGEQSSPKNKEPGAKKNFQAQKRTKMPNRQVRSDRIGYEYANRN